MAFRKPDKPEPPVGGAEHGAGCMCLYHRTRRSAELREAARRALPETPVPKVPVSKNKRGT